MTHMERQYSALVVEDDVHTRELVVFNLEDAGYLVHSAGNGVEALALLAERVVDIIICDIMMPEMDGFALREAVQQQLAGGATRLLINLKDVSTIDSSGVGELVSAYTTVTNRGGKLKLVNLPPKVNDILQITQLITVFETFNNEEEAIGSF